MIYYLHLQRNKFVLTKVSFSFLQLNCLWVYHCVPEISNNLNCLYLTISQKEQSLKFKIYWKPTFTDAIILAHYRQAYNIKLSSFHNLIHCFLTIPFSYDNLNRDANVLKAVSLNNGCSQNVVPLGWVGVYQDCLWYWKPST